MDRDFYNEKDEADEIISSIRRGVHSDVPNKDDTIGELYGRRPTSYGPLEKEKFEHRLILWMCANGQSSKEIAQATGYSYNGIQKIKSQSWFRQQFVELTTKMGKDSVNQFLKGEVMNSLEKLVEIRDTAPKASDQRAAADSILDRFLGKATAKVEVQSTSTVVQSTAEAAALKQEAQRIAQQLQARGISFTPSTS